MLVHVGSGGHGVGAGGRQDLHAICTREECESRVSHKVLIKKLADVNAATKGIPKP